MVISARKFCQTKVSRGYFIQFISNKNSNVGCKYLKLISNS